MKKDYLYWIIFFVLFAINFKVLEVLWESIALFNGVTDFVSRLIITLVSFIVSIIITEGVNKIIKIK